MEGGEKEKEREIENGRGREKEKRSFLSFRPGGWNERISTPFMRR